MGNYSQGYTLYINCKLDIHVLVLKVRSIYIEYKCLEPKNCGHYRRQVVYCEQFNNGCETDKNKDLRLKIYFTTTDTSNKPTVKQKL